MNLRNRRSKLPSPRSASQGRLRTVVQRATVRPLYERASIGVRRALNLLGVLALVSITSAAILDGLEPEPSEQGMHASELIRRARIRTVLAAASVSKFDSLLTEIRAVKLNLAPRPYVRGLFLQLEQAYGQWTRITHDSIAVGLGEGIEYGTRGAAVYGRTGKLLAWYSDAPATFLFDTTISPTIFGEFQTSITNINRGPIYTYLTTTRKIVAAGRVEGFAVARALIGVRIPSTGGEVRSFTYIDDLLQASSHPAEMTFAEVRDQHSDDKTTRISLYNDPLGTLYFGQLVIADEAVVSLSSVSHRLRQAFDIFSGLFALIVVLWITSRVTAYDIRTRPLLTRLRYSLYLFIVLFVFRAVLVGLPGITTLIGQQFQASKDFGTVVGFGLAENPLQMFITTFFATAYSLLLWVLWIPHRRLVRSDTERERTSHEMSSMTPIIRKESPLLLAYILAALAAAQLLFSLLNSVVMGMVGNGTINYSVISTILPSAGQLMMYLSFLNIGVAFLFLVSLILVFAFRAVVFLLPRRLAIVWRVTIGAFLFLGLIFCSCLLAGSERSAGIRLFLFSVTAFLSIGLVLIDAFADPEQQDSPSFLYRLPRSNRSILFVIAASAIITAPLILRSEFKAERAKAIQAVGPTRNVTFLKTQVHRVLAQAVEYVSEANAKNQRGNSQGITAERSVPQTASFVWITNLASLSSLQVSIDVLDANESILSHYGSTRQFQESAPLKIYRDSLMRILRSSEAESPIFLQDPCFPPLCMPFVIGGAHALSTQKTPGSAAYVIVSCWSTLDPQQQSSDLVPLLSGSARRDADPYITTIYRPNARRVTNAPSLNIPASVPPIVEAKLQRRKGNKFDTVWQRSVFGDRRYATLYFHENAGPNDSTSYTVAVSLPETTPEIIAELALRLNAVGLIYGIAIALAILILRLMSAGRVRYNLRFRDRIFLLVLVIALVPLAIVTNVTRNLLTARAENEENERLARDAAVVSDKMRESMESGLLNIYGFGIEREALELAESIGRDFNVYDNTGILRASSKPELYLSTYLSTQLSPTAMKDVVLGSKAFATEELRIGAQRFSFGYQPIESSVGHDLLGVLRMSGLEQKTRIEADVARTTSLIYSTFAALGLVLLGIGAAFAARVAMPILTLIQATKRVAEGKLRTSIRVNREDEIGELMRAFNTMTDELDKSREIVAQNERESAWKEMARQVAHEIKNPLTPMKLSVQHVEHAFETQDPNFNPIFKRVIKTLGEQISVLTRIATEFARFGEMPRRRYSAVSLQKVAESAVALFDAERHRIRFIIEAPADLSYIHADEEEFRRALVNLLRNAIQATESWGVIAIRATEEGGMIHLTITDTGGGMPEETLRKAFDPNFSTKTSGMGLGLAIVKKTITDMSGSISVDSTVGRGTTFSIDLPARTSLAELNERDEEPA